MLSQLPDAQTSSPHVAHSTLDLRVPSGVAVGDILGFPRATYQNILRSKPCVLPEGLPLTNRRRIAFEGALAYAFSQPDQVRQLVVFVRAYALRMSAPEYAQELGLKSHSYSHLEARGFDPHRSVASSFGCFLRDWERRAESRPEAEPFFRWAQRRLERLLVGRELGTPLGFFLKCQNRVGTKSFADATGLTPKILSDYRTFKRNITFSEMLGVVEALSASKSAKRDSAQWDSPLVAEARRVFVHHSLRLGRSASVAKVHMLLAWANMPLTGPGIRREIPMMTDNEASKMARFEPVTAAAWAKIKMVQPIIEKVPQRFIDDVDLSRGNQRWDR